MENFELKLKVSPSDKKFKQLLGDEKYKQILEKTFKEDNCTCQGCGYHPPNENKIGNALSLHVLEINEEVPEESDCTTLCLACHSLQHIDVSLKNEWVQLVNSTFSQKRLIEMCRINAVHHSLNDENTRYLAITSEQFIEKITTGLLSNGNKVKAIFTNKFEWGDL